MVSILSPEGCVTAALGEGPGVPRRQVDEMEEGLKNILEEAFTKEDNRLQECTE